MKIDPSAQNSLEWLLARSGVVTASEMDALITPKFKIKTGEGPKSYLAQKVAEKWIGGPLPSFMTLDMEFGKILEEECLPAYEFQTNDTITRVGLCLTDDGRVGCSPDGLLGDDGGIEAKCPRPDTHVKYLLNGEVPDDYLVQVHAAMYVTGRPWWRFVSYHRRLPMLILTVQRDEEKQAIIAEALTMFLAYYDDAYNRLCDINGGPPARFAKPTEPEPQPQNDDIRV